MGVTRQQLYKEVWADPMIVVAARYDVSGSYLARVCKQMNVPRPERGYWAKLKVGKAPPQPPLPDPEPGDELEWTKGQYPSQRMRKLHIPQKKRRQYRKSPKTPSGIHPLCHGVDQYYEAARLSDEGYLKPYKKLLVDLYVTMDSLPHALDLASKFFLELESFDHRVMIAPKSEPFQRPELFTCENADKPMYFKEGWKPFRPTVVYVDSVPYGLSLYEISEEVEVRYKNGKYVPVSSDSPPHKKSNGPLDDWNTTREYPTGRLGIRAYSPYYRVPWEQHWREKTAGDLDKQLTKIRRTLQRSAGTIAKQAEDVRKQMEEDHSKRKIFFEKWNREQEKKKRKQAYKESQEQLLSIIESWSLACRIESFLETIDKEADSLESEKRDALKARLDIARKMFGNTDVLQYFMNWKSPSER